MDVYTANLARVGIRDVVISSIGCSGQALVTNVLVELGIAFVDSLIDVLEKDGSSRPASSGVGLRQHYAALSSGRKHLCRRGPRFVRTHAFPGEVDHAAARGVWLVVRDPRDAVYSAYRFLHTTSSETDVDLEEFGKWAVGTGRVPGRHTAQWADWRSDPVRSWADFHTAWLEASPRIQTFVVSRFEDLKTTPVSTIGNALAAFGVSVPGAELERALAASSYEAMRAHEESVLRTQPGTPDVRVMRRGKVGEWTGWMTSQLATPFLDEHVLGAADELGYDLRPMAGLG